LASRERGTKRRKSGGGGGGASSGAPRPMGRASSDSMAGSSAPDSKNTLGFKKMGLVGGSSRNLLETFKSCKSAKDLLNLDDAVVVTPTFCSDAGSVSVSVSSSSESSGPRSRGGGGGSTGDDNSAEDELGSELPSFDEYSGSVCTLSRSSTSCSLDNNLSATDVMPPKIASAIVVPALPNIQSESPAGLCGGAGRIRPKKRRKAPARRDQADWGWFVCADSNAQMNLIPPENEPSAIRRKRRSVSSNSSSGGPLAFGKFVSVKSDKHLVHDVDVRWASAADTVDEVLGPDFDFPEM